MVIMTLSDEEFSLLCACLDITMEAACNTGETDLLTAVQGLADKLPKPAVASKWVP